jgi:hypothetical protein
MTPDRASMTAEIERFSALGEFPGQTISFLRRPAALDFMQDYMADTGKPLSETVLIFLTAIRFVDGVTRGDPQSPSILEEEPGRVNLDLFLVRHHDELYRLCLNRHVQANVPQRALPLMELLGRRYGDRPLAVIEPGCSLGLIGRLLCAPESVMAHFDEWFEAGQQRPDSWPRVLAYRGSDLSVPEPSWVLAGLHRTSDRVRLARLLRDLPPGGPCQLAAGSAESFAEQAAVQELAPRFDPAHPQALVPVVLTAYLQYQLEAGLRQRLADAVRAFTARHGGSWINLEPRLADGAYRFFVEQDGVDRIALENDLCRTWSWLPEA